MSIKARMVPPHTRGPGAGGSSRDRRAYRRVARAYAAMKPGQRCSACQGSGLYYGRHTAPVGYCQCTGLDWLGVFLRQLRRGLYRAYAAARALDQTRARAKARSYTCPS